MSFPTFRADLHCHTTCSDGSLSPKEIIALAKKVGLQGLSITDHDTIEAYKEAIPAAKEAGILLGAGVEFSSYEKNLSVHVLGYDIELEHPGLIAFCKKHQTRRKERNRRILEKLEKMGMVIREEDLLASHIVGRGHIAEALLKKGYVGSLQEAFQRFIGDRKPCFDPGEPFALDETLEVIHQAGGLAFLAHPHLYSEGSKVRKLLEKPFDGIECYYARSQIEQEKRWIRQAEQKGLLISGGSDFHGALRPSVPLGASWANEEAFRLIFKKIRLLS